MKMSPHPYLEDRALKRYESVRQFIFAPIPGLTTEPLYVYWCGRWGGKISYKIQDWSKWYRIGWSMPFQPNRKMINGKLMIVYASIWESPQFGFSPRISLVWQENPKSGYEFSDGPINYVHPISEKYIKGKGGLTT